MRRTMTIGLSCFFLFYLSLALGCKPRPPRIVLVTLDTVRYDSVFGQGAAASMPLTAAWAQKGARFTHFYSASASTQPSHAAMLSGLHPWNSNVTQNGRGLPDSVVTVPERLRAAGFHTGAAVASFPVSGALGFGQGFDIFDDEFTFGTVKGKWAEAAGQGEASPPVPLYRLADQVVSRAIEQLESSPEGPQFFWFHFYDPHSPYGDVRPGPTTTPRMALEVAKTGGDPSLEVATARSLYDVDAEFLDLQLAKLFRALETREDEFSTHIVVVSDHGESFGESGSMAHGRRLIPSQIRVPCIIVSNSMAPGERFDIGGSVDVGATLLSLGGLTEKGLDGSDLRRVDVSREARGMRRTYDEPYEDIRLDGSTVWLEEPLFYVVRPSEGLIRGTSRGLTTHSGGPVDSSTERSLLREFRSLEKILKDAPSSGPKRSETQEALRSLGYVG